MSNGKQERATAADVIVRSFRDSVYRRRLVDEPAAVLREAGISIPDGTEVTLLENTNSLSHVAIPSAENLVAGLKADFLAQLGGLLPLPAGVELRLHQETTTQRFFVLPIPPADPTGLSEEELADVVAAGNGGDGGLFGGNGGNGGAGGNAGNGGLFGNGGNG